MTSTTSPNNSNSMSDIPSNGFIGGGMISFEEHELMNFCMDSISTTTSSSSIQNSITSASYQFDPFPPLHDNSYDTMVAPRIFNVSNHGIEGGIFDDYGGFEQYVTGFENDLSVPSLENDGNAKLMFDKRSPNGGKCLIDSDQNIKVEDFDFGSNNHWQGGQNLKMGSDHLDWESLLANVSFSPYLDFQIE